MRARRRAQRERAATFRGVSAVRDGERSRGLVAFPFGAAQGNDAGAQPGVGGEDAVIAVAVDAGRRNEAGKGREDLEALITAVEADVRARDDAVIVHNWHELDDALLTDKVILIHSVEGGFHIGHTPEAIRANIAKLADRGVAYITVAHLFFRQIATNAPALPFITDDVYNKLFPQKSTDTVVKLGEALIRAMAEKHILIDITHMSHRAIEATLGLLDRIELETGATRKIPVIATHTACRFGKSEYNITDYQIEAVARRNGLIGLITCTHWMADGLEEPTNLDESLAPTPT